MTRRQLVAHFDHLADQLNGDAKFQASLHGAKLKGTLERHKFDPESNKLLSGYSEKLYKDMMEGLR